MRYFKKFVLILARLIFICAAVAAIFGIVAAVRVGLWWWAAFCLAALAAAWTALDYLFSDDFLWW